MGKSTNKKGKQKEATPGELASGQVPPPAPPAPSAPPPPPAAPSPPLAQHIQYPPVTIDTIEEEDEYGGLGGLVEEESESWQDVGQTDGAVDGWAPNEPENGNGGWGGPVDNDGWEESAPPPPPMPPPPPQPLQKHSVGGKAHAKQHQQQHQHQQPQPQQQHRHHQQHQQHQQAAAGWGASGGANKATVGWADPKHQQPKGGWPNATNNGWGDDGLGDQDDYPEDEWEGDDDGWNENTGGAWSQQQPHSAAWGHATSGHSAHSQATSRATGGWQSWSEEARRLPKVTFDPAIPSSPSSTGSKTVLSQLQRSQILNALLNKPQQSQQPYPNPPKHGTSFPPAAAKSWEQYQQMAAVPLQPQPQPHGKRHQQQQQYPQLHHAQQHMQHHELQHPPQHQQEQHNHREGKKNKKNKHHQEQQQQPQEQGKKNKKRQQEEDEYDPWGLGDGWGEQPDEEDYYDDTHDAWGRKVHFSPAPAAASIHPSAAPSIAPSAIVENFTVNAFPQNKLGLSTIPMSKTLSYAYSGTATSTGSGAGRAAMQQIADVQFIESQGEALKSVRRAFYSKSRRAEDRFHWLFPPEKDERVSSLLHWIQSVSFGVASFGLQKFLHTRERGALIVNADYRPAHSPNEPAFDWVTWEQIQPTMDRILQESVGYYNPAIHIIVLVLLPSPSGNSVAIWRRKIPIPNNIRLAYQAQITQAIASLRKEYPVLVDELPSPLEDAPPPPPPKKKRKWYKLWLST